MLASVLATPFWIVWFRPWFWTSNELNKFPFNLIGQSNNGFLTGQSWRLLKSRYTAGYAEQGVRRWYACELNQSFNFVFCINLRKQPTFESSRRQGWLPGEMTSEKRLQKFHTDDVSLPRSGQWHVISMKILRSFLRPHFAWRPVVASRRLEMSTVFSCYGGAG